jgi:hypothetical protein
MLKIMYVNTIFHFLKKMKSALFLLCAIITVVTAIQKSCSYEFARTSNEVFNFDYKFQDMCYVNCHDCVDQTICHQVLNDLNLLDPNTTMNASTITMMKNLCNTNVNDNEQHATTCGTGGSCTIFCRMCRDFDICVALKTLINRTTSDAPYLLVSVNNKILNQCRDVTSNNAIIHLPHLLLYGLILGSILMF